MMSGYAPLTNFTQICCGLFFLVPDIGIIYSCGTGIAFLQRLSIRLAVTNYQVDAHRFCMGGNVSVKEHIGSLLDMQARLGIFAPLEVSCPSCANSAGDDSALPAYQIPQSKLPQKWIRKCRAPFFSTSLIEKSFTAIFKPDWCALQRR